MDITALLASPATASAPGPAATETDGSVFAQALDAAAQAQPVEAITPDTTVALPVAVLETAAEPAMTAATAVPLAEPEMSVTPQGEPPAASVPDEASVPSAIPVAQPAAPAVAANTPAKPQVVASQQPEEIEPPEASLPMVDESQPPENDDGTDSQLQHIRNRMHLIDTAGTPDASTAQAYTPPVAIPLAAATPVLAEAPAQAAPAVTVRSTQLPAVTSTTGNPGKAQSAAAVPPTTAVPADTVTDTAVMATATDTPSDGNETGADSDIPSPQPLDTLSAWTPVTGGVVSSEPAPTATGNPTLTAAVGSSQWQSGLSQQVLSLHQRGKHQVDLQLHPADLGPLSISLKQDTSGTQAQFICAHPAVRTAVEQALPQLREALAAQGITLGDTSVSDQPSRQAQREQSPYAPPAASAGAGAVADEDPSEAQPTPLMTRIDLYT
ncbi:flagellar hook-length control protein FliK [Pseudomonas sp.]|uniref:flagellar hook-length control protein FliK n=1 Tax=Pseudomonas sp. TaxID=306 RepID=UPI00258E54D0|nr:flagellar hook-length control protein FliK [Pseudomonas sp.]